MWRASSANLLRPTVQRNPVARFDIAEISRSLERTQADFKSINKTLRVRRAPLTNETSLNMIDGYRFIDSLLARGTDLFAVGNSSLLLEINTLVLCGASAADRRTYAEHIEQTRRQFYDDRHGGIGSVMEWFKFHLNDDLWYRAAGLYIQITSQPQLFIEGNHRSAILMISFLLAREGWPPFVMTSNNAKTLLDQSEPISDLKKHSLGAFIHIPHLRNQLACTLKSGLDERHVLRL